MKQPAFIGSIIDRADPVRNDPARLAQAFSDPQARQLLLDGLDPVVDGDIIATAPIGTDADPASYALLGIGEDGPVFVRLANDLGEGSTSNRVRDIAGHVAAPTLALYGTARSLVHWHVHNRFCPRCGHATLPNKAGWARRCDATGGGCGAEHFPRVDPVTIMLAQHRGRVLLGRSPRFPAGRYSALAGFIEPGETIEEAVARETWEEAGVRVTSVRYVMSQPWPFPSSLMIACVADALDDRLDIDRTELEDAIWVDADGVRAALAGDSDAPFVAPPAMAVAYHLLAHWLDAQTQRA